MNTTIHQIQGSAAGIIVGFTRGDTGFLIQFPNGYGLSVQWSAGHMCSVYSHTFPPVADCDTAHSLTAECCETTPSGLGKVHSYCSPEAVLKLLRKMERKQTAAERAMARQCRIENAQRKHGWHDTPEYAPKGDDNAND